MRVYEPGCTINGVLTEHRTVQPELPFTDIKGNQHSADIFARWTPEELAAVGTKIFIEDVVPMRYRGGAPVDIEDATTVHRTYPNAIFEPEPWRTQLAAAIQGRKVQMRDSGFIVDGVRFDSDANANVQYLNFFTLVSQDPTYKVDTWKASDDNWVVMDATLFMKVSAAFAINTQAAFTWQSATLTQLAAATTPADFQAIEDAIRAQ